MKKKIILEHEITTSEDGKKCDPFCDHYSIGGSGRRKCKLFRENVEAGRAQGCMHSQRLFEKASEEAKK